MPDTRMCLCLAIAAVGLMGCAEQHTMRLPDAPVAREVYPDHDAYKRFRADAGSMAAVTVCKIEAVGFVPTSA